jgi:hypothetical protein
MNFWETSISLTQQQIASPFPSHPINEPIGPCHYQQEMPLFLPQSRCTYFHVTAGLMMTYFCTYCKVVFFVCYVTTLLQLQKCLQWRMRWGRDFEWCVDRKKWRWYIWIYCLSISIDRLRKTMKTTHLEYLFRLSQRSGSLPKRGKGDGRDGNMAVGMMTQWRKTHTARPAKKSNWHPQAVKLWFPRVAVP